MDMNEPSREGSVSLVDNNRIRQQSIKIESLISPASSTVPFSWGAYLTTTNSHAAPVHFFRHTPLSEMWLPFGPGMKLEVINNDCLNHSLGTKEKIYWFASVIRIEGYLALVRYEGYDEDSSMDFWCNLCDSDVHCVGWCGQNNIKLVPPRTIEHQQTDWKSFLVNRLVGSKTLPDSFRRKLQASIHRCPFKKNLRLEVIDKYRVSRMRIGKITAVIGDRLQISYENMMDEHFTVHETSNLIHPLGWSKRIGHEIETTPELQIEIDKIIETNVYPAGIVPPHIFHQHPKNVHSQDEEFREGQKLEAVDPLDMSRISPATVAKVLGDGYFMLSIDGTGVEDGSDWFCYHSSSRLIFPVDYCKLNDLSLSPPSDYQGDFQWDKYLRETNSVYAPRELFQVVKEHCVNPFTVGMKIEAVDLIAPELICVATIAQVAANLIRVHFDGWSTDFEQWIDCQSPNIYPVGWCQMIGHDLEPPKEPSHEKVTKSRPSKRSNGRKSNKRKRIA